MIKLKTTGEMNQITMSGKKNNNDCVCKSSGTTLKDLYNAQLFNQKLFFIKGAYDNFKSEETKDVPCDDIKLASYHIQQLVSEIGEVLESDKRWKNYRNDKYDREHKLEELADCFIVLINLAIFSDFHAEELTDAVLNKIMVVRGRTEEL